jgi:dienelactone hydrolase
MQLSSAITAIAVGLGICTNAAPADPLPGTMPLEWPEEDLSERLMDGAHVFVERKIAEAVKAPKLRGLSLDEKRQRFRKMIGVVDPLLPPGIEFVAETSGFITGEPMSSLVAKTPAFTVHQVRWPVLDGFSGEGLYVNPVRKDNRATATPPPAIVLIPDASETPEDLLGIGNRLPSEQQIGLRFAEAGFRLIIPATIDRKIYLGPNGDDTRIKRSDQSHREWIYRQAFQMGRHVIGYEVQTALAAADWLREIGTSASVGVAGYGEGGLVAFYAAAADPTIEHCFVSGYFGPRKDVSSEPIYRNVFGLLRDFGDAEIADLISPRPLMIEHSPFPDGIDQKGTIAQPTFAEVEAEFRRIRPDGRTQLEKVRNQARADFSALSVHTIEIDFETDVSRLPPVSLLLDQRLNFDPAARHQRIFQGMQNHVQSLIDDSNRVRREHFFYTAEPKLEPGKWSTNAEHPTLDPANFVESSKAFREEFRHDLIGEFNEPLAPASPRSRQILDNENWTAWDVTLQVYAEFFAWGTLLLPKDLKPNEKRPVVVCQHGRNGVPLDTINAGNTAYNDFAARLCERGFIVFAPHNLYRGEDRYRWLDRKANSVGCSMFSLITASHQTILDWLKAQANVDSERIAFYGLSYGGESAVRLPALLEDYCLSICSGDFNQWTRKVAAVDFPGSFMNTIEWEMPYWNLGNTFDYAEMAALIFPRPFMVERGHHDRVSVDEWVAHEYAKVRWLYAQFGMADRTEIEFFQGGHSINGKGSFDFLHKHLNWPKP